MESWVLIPPDGTNSSGALLGRATTSMRFKKNTAESSSESLMKTDVFTESQFATQRSGGTLFAPQMVVIAPLG